VLLLVTQGAAACRALHQPRLRPAASASVTWVPTSASESFELGAGAARVLDLTDAAAGRRRHRRLDRLGRACRAWCPRDTVVELEIEVHHRRRRDPRASESTTGGIVGLLPHGRLAVSGSTPATTVTIDLEATRSASATLEVRREAS
jgi:hypothetical protein